MLTVENFKKSVELCEKRDALLSISRELNQAIEDRPMPMDVYRKTYIKAKAHNGIILFLCIITVMALGMRIPYIELETEADTFIYVIFSFFIAPFIVAVIAKIIDRIFIIAKGQAVFNQHRIIMNRFYEQIQPQLLKERESVNNEIQIVVDQLNSFDGIPSSEWDVASELWYLYSSHQADSYKEAVWVWRDIQHKNLIEQEMGEQSRLARETAKCAQESRENTYQAMIESKRARETAELGVLLGAYNTYKLSKY